MPLWWAVLPLHARALVTVIPRALTTILPRAATKRQESLPFYYFALILPNTTYTLSRPTIKTNQIQYQ